MERGLHPPPIIKSACSHRDRPCEGSGSHPGLCDAGRRRSWRVRGWHPDVLPVILNPVMSPPIAQALVSLCSIVLMGLAFQPWDVTAAAWVGLVPLLAGLVASPHPESRRRFLWDGALFGAGYHLLVLIPFVSIGWWGWGATTLGGVRQYVTYAHLFMWTLVILIALWAGLVFGMLSAWLRPWLRHPVAAVLVVPAAWTFLLEFLGHRSVFNFGWGLLGNRLHAQPVLRQVASLTGVWGLSFLLVMVNTLLALWLVHLTGRDGRRHPSRALWSATIVVCCIVGLAAGYGAHRLRATETGAGTPVWRVALLQGARSDYAEEDFTPEGLDRLYAPMIRQAAETRADLIVLPETVWLRTLVLGEPAGPTPGNEALPQARLQTALADVLGERPAVVAIGMDTQIDGQSYNATSFWTAGALLGVYRKQRLVPFAEYRPALVGRFAPQNVIHGEAFTFQPGVGPQLVTVRGVPVGNFICQEVLFPALIRDSVRAGAQLLISTGNDGVFTSPIVAWEQANLAVLRAVETGRYVLRAMKSGVSLVIDPQGRRLAALGVGEQGLVEAAVSPRTERTPSVRFGDWFAWLCGAVVAVAVGWRTRLGGLRER